MLESPNFGHMTTSTLQLESGGNILLGKSWTEIMTSQPLFQNTFILKRPRVANFTGIMKIATMFIKTTFKTYALKFNLYLHFLKSC